jgi:hypothetical protein
MTFDFSAVQVDGVIKHRGRDCDVYTCELMLWVFFATESITDSFPGGAAADAIAEILRRTNNGGDYVRQVFRESWQALQPATPREAFFKLLMSNHTMTEACCSGKAHTIVDFPPEADADGDGVPDWLDQCAFDGTIGEREPSTEDLCIALWH